MGYEVEVKYRAVDHPTIARRLQDMGAEGGAIVAQQDVYLKHPGRDFAQTNEALRLRRVGEENRITYKGPRHPGPTKTREEIELAFPPGPDIFAEWLRLFENLGFRPVATIRKSRASFHLQFRGCAIEIALDAVEGLGSFAEVEALAQTREQLPDAQAAVLELARQLDLAEVEPRSYLRMVLESAGS